jgi:hypothetical protein
MPAFAFTVGSFGDILAAAGLAARICKTLRNSYVDSLSEARALELELQSLQQVLISTGEFVERYKSTPLGPVFTKVVDLEVTQCHRAMYLFYAEIHGYRDTLTSTVIKRVWGKVMWAGTDKAASLRVKLSSHREKLITILVAVNSFVPLSVMHIMVSY